MEDGGVGVKRKQTVKMKTTYKLKLSETLIILMIS